MQPDDDDFPTMTRLDLLQVVSFSILASTVAFGAVVGAHFILG